MNFKLISECALVSGFAASAIYNFKKQNVTTISNDLYDFLYKLNSNDFVEVLNSYPLQEKQVLEKVLVNLDQKGLGFYTDDNSFSTPSFDFNIPSHIYCAVVEYYDDKHYHFDDLVFQLDALLCKQVEIRLLSPDLTEEKVTRIIDAMATGTFECINLLIQGNDNLGECFINSLHANNKKIDYIIVFNSDVKSTANNKVKYSNKSISVMAHLRHFDKYVINVKYFTESKQFNPFYHKKVAIDKFGNIKNDLICTNSFGNLRNTALQTVICHNDFRAFWDASPDKIVDLKLSPLRYCLYPNRNLRRINKTEYTFV